jgi:hypothetical protein
MVLKILKTSKNFKNRKIKRYKMKYYKLNNSGTKWGLIANNNDLEFSLKYGNYKQIELYDEKLNLIGIGLY